ASQSAFKGRGGSSGGKKATERSKTAKRTLNVPQFFLTLKGNASTVRTDLSWQERVKHEWETNREGFLTSLGLHTFLLILFALWMLPSGGQGRLAILHVGWTPVPSAKAKEAMSQPVKIDTQLGPVRTSAGLSETKAKLPDTKPAEVKAGPGVVAAKPVAVGRALASRTGSGRAAIWQDLNVEAKSERGIGAGLSWLVRKQEKGGNWKLHEGYPDAGERVIRTDTGATALALLAFL